MALDRAKLGRTQLSWVVYVWALLMLVLVMGPNGMHVEGGLRDKIKKKLQKRQRQEQEQEQPHQQDQQPSVDQAPLVENDTPSTPEVGVGDMADGGRVGFELNEPTSSSPVGAGAGAVAHAGQVDAQQSHDDGSAAFEQQQPADDDEVSHGAHAGDQEDKDDEEDDEEEGDEDEDIDLPPGWYEYDAPDSDGKKYYYNPTLGTTQWEKPCQVLDSADSQLSVLDRCGVCGGDGTSCAGCKTQGAANYNATAVFHNATLCIYPRPPSTPAPDSDAPQVEEAKPDTVTKETAVDSTFGESDTARDKSTAASTTADDTAVDREKRKSQRVISSSQVGDGDAADSSVTAVERNAGSADKMGKGQQVEAPTVARHAKVQEIDSSPVAPPTEGSCGDPSACNFDPDPSKVSNHTACVFPVPGHNCEGKCVQDRGAFGWRFHHLSQNSTSCIVQTEFVFMFPH